VKSIMNSRTLVLPLLLAVVGCGAGATPPPPAPAPLPAAVPVASTAAPVAVDPAAAPSEDDAAVPISTRNPTWGSRTALVTIVEFSDLQCPFCSRVLPTLSQLREKYGPENLRIVWKNNPLPFHPNARPAAEAAMGVQELAGPQAFWRFHDRVFADQSSMGQDSYERWASEVGVRDIEALRAGLASHRWAAPVEADMNEARDLGMNGTPSFLVNGVPVVGAQPLETFEKTIDAELAKARAKVEAGTPRARVYAEMARENRANTPKPAEEEEEHEDTKTVFKIPVGTSPVRGNANALVTIVEFADFQCPFSARVQPTLEAVRAKYGDRVRIVWKNLPLPFHPNAEPAAQAALEVRAERGDAAFWAMHDRLFAEQKLLAGASSVQNVKIDVLTRLASEVGASADRVRRAVATHAHARAIDADQDLSDDFEANGTPHFFINGRRLVGAQPEEKFDAIIDEEIRRAQAVLSVGTPPGTLYDALVRNGKGPPPPETKDMPTAMPANEPMRGGAGARVTLHEWADFQCPFCGRAEATLAQVLKDYGPRVRLVWHDLPLPMHPDAPLAAEAGREAMKQRGSTGFWALHDLIFLDQKRLKRADLDGYAQTLGFDMRRWRAALDGEAHESEIDAEKRLAEGMNIQGTPAFVVVPAGASRGYFISGAQPFAKFRKILDRALGEAR
jgi:protein-disulfide isomerase